MNADVYPWFYSLALQYYNRTVWFLNHWEFFNQSLKYSGQLIKIKNTRNCKRMVRIRRKFHCRLQKQHNIFFLECLLSGFKLSGSYSGCRDGSTEGFADHKDVHACKGKWEGHVKKGRSLCQRGWRVCSPRDQASLRYISWIDIFDLQGCYAYNAENTRGKCKR